MAEDDGAYGAYDDDASSVFGKAQILSLQEMLMLEPENSVQTHCWEAKVRAADPQNFRCLSSWL